MLFVDKMCKNDFVTCITYFCCHFFFFYSVIIICDFSEILFQNCTVVMFQLYIILFLFLGILIQFWVYTESSWRGMVSWHAVKNNDKMTACQLYTYGTLSRIYISTKIKYPSKWQLHYTKFNISVIRRYIHTYISMKHTNKHWYQLSTAI